MKRMKILLLVLVLLLGTALPVFAEEGSVTYDGDAKAFIFTPGSAYSPTDLFPNFKGVMPGDTLTQPITVKNDAAKNVKVKIYMRSLGAHDDSEAFLSQLHLRVEKSAENDMAYMFDAAADETAQLTDWVLLGTLYSGGEVNLNVLLEVPVELDNAYSEQIGYLDWEFKVEEYPVEDEDPDAPDTGDHTDLGLWIALAVGSAVILLVLLVFGRRKKKDDDQ